MTRQVAHGNQNQDPATGPVITLFTSRRKPLAKTFSMEGGKLVKTAAAALYDGTARVVTAPDAATLARGLDSLTQRQAVGLGVLKDGAARADVVSESIARPGAVTRTLKHFGCRPGAGWLLWDYDIGGAPDHLLARIDAVGGPVEAFFHIWPEARQSEYLIRASSSDGIVLPDGRVQRSSGLHGYFLIADVARSAEVLDILHRRAWAAGLGWIMLSKGGAMLSRSIIDVTVASPERLVFEAAPILRDGITRQPSAPIINSTGVVAQIPGESLAQCGAADAAEQAAKDAIKPEAAEVEATFRRERK